MRTALRASLLPAATLALVCAVTPAASAVAASPHQPANGPSTTPASEAATGSAPASGGARRAATPPPAAQARLTDRLRAATEGSVRISRHARTGGVRFVGTAPGSPVPRPAGLLASASPERSARAFLDGYGALFGVHDEATQLRVSARRGGAHGSTAVRFQQTHHGLPVVGGEIVVTVDSAGNTLSANGETSSGLTVDTTPRLGAAAAAEAATEVAAKAHHLPAAALRAAAPALSVYDPALLDAPGPRVRSLVWRTEVRSSGGDVRELVLVDARTGAVALHFDENPEAKQRSVCDFGNVPKPTDACIAPFARVEGGAATGARDVDLAYDYAGVTYDFYNTTFGRDSLDGHGLPLKSTVRYCPPDSPGDCPFANAYWNGTQMVYGDTYASADDVVGHELTHGVTEFTSGLFYYFQSGAINESFSDVFGELIDLTDGRGNDSAAVRWQMGEDLPIGAIRDMMHPERFQNPDRMTSPFYVTDTSDAGGVHTNSGVNNKAAALLVDGGTFNGQTITGLGTEKVARIYYEAGTRLMTSATDYNDLFDILQQACRNLVGTHGVSAADCTSVTKAVTATEMNLQPKGAEVPEAPVCATGQVRTDIFADDLEHPASGSWVKARKSGFGWAYPQSDSNPTYGGFNPVYATSGGTEMWGDDPDSASDATIAKKAPFKVPAGRKTYLRFAHAFDFETLGSSAIDGGRVEYTTDNGSTWSDAGRLAVNGGYTSTDVGALGGPGFGGVSGGYTSSRFDLSSLAGKSVRFRFRVASDSSVGGYGWFIDDVAVYSCAAPQPAIRVGDAVVKEGPAGKTSTATFEVTRSSGTGTSSVKYATAGGSATSGTDFTARALSTLTFAAGQTRKNVTVPVRGDVVPEAHETFSLRLSAPVGATLADASGTGTITDDDPGTPARLSVSDPVVVEGSTGTTNAVFTVTRTGTTAEPVTVTYATVAGTAGSADFRALPATALTLPAGAASARVTVPVVGDTLDEPNETFSLVLSKAVRATLADASGTATVVDDEGAPVAGPTTFYAVSDLRVTEGAAGASTTATMTVTRTGDTSGSGSVVVATRGGTATSGVDYAALPATTVSFAPGQTSRPVAIRVTGDAVPEPHETVQLRASSPVGGTLADDTGVLTIGDTDPGTPARLTVDDVAVREGGSGARNATFTVTRTGSTLEPVTVSWATAPATAPFVPAATAGRDYIARPATALTFAAGETSKRVTVPVLADSTFEPNEYLLVTLSGPVGAAIADGTGVGTVLDDD